VRHDIYIYIYIYVVRRQMVKELHIGVALVREYMSPPLHREARSRISLLQSVWEISNFVKNNDNNHHYLLEM
jgi:hypothetical protein